MSQAMESYAVWLADFYLLTAVLLTLALAALAVLRQPAKRLAIVKSTLIAVILLGAFCSIPGWSVVHLLRPTQLSPVAPSHADVRTVAAIVPNDAAQSMNTSVPLRPAAPVLSSEPIGGRASEENSRRISWPIVFGAVHLAGGFFASSWLVLGWFAARRLRCSARPAPPSLVAMMNEWRHGEAAPSVEPVLLISDRIEVAVALGAPRAVILLPSRWVNDSPPAAEKSGNPAAPSDLRAVLAHELTHVANHDLHWVAVALALVIALWANPLFWVLRRRLRLDQEALADAAAAEVTSRQTYAEQLVAWAREVSGRPSLHLSSAVGLWEGPSQLRQRIAILLNERFTVVRACTRRWRVASVVVCTLLAVSLSMLTLKPGQGAPRKDTTSPSSTSNGSDETSIPKEYRQEANSIIGRVAGQNDKAIEGAEVSLFRINRITQERKLVARNLTGADGLFQFDQVIDIATEFPDGKLWPLNTNDEEFVQGYVRKAGFATDSRTDLRQRVAKTGVFFEFKMPSAGTLKGRVTGPDGKPVANALVAEGGQGSGALRWDGALSARTNADGTYEITDAARFDIEVYRKKVAEEQKQRETAWMMFTPPPILVVEHPDFARKYTDYEHIPGTRDVKLEPAAVIEGRVVYGDSKKPAAAVTVHAETYRPNNTLPRLGNTSEAPLSLDARTDAGGRYRFEMLPAGKYNLLAEKADWVNEGIKTFDAPAEKTSTAPDLVLTKGGIVSIRLVDAKTEKPIPITGDERADLYAVSAVKLDERPNLGPNRAPNSEKRFDLRTLPGKRGVFVGMVSVGEEQKWAGKASAGPFKPQAVVDVVEGQTVQADAPVVDLKELPNHGVTATLQLAPTGSEPATTEKKKKPATPKKKEGASKKPANIHVIVARHVLLLDGKEIITWDDLEAKIAALGFPSVAIPHFYITNGAMESGVEKDAKPRIYELHRKYKLQGHSEGSLAARTSMRYDAIRDKADLTPDPSLRVEGTVVDSEGKPVAGAEVVLITPLPKPEPNVVTPYLNMYDIALVKGRLRNRLDEVVTDTNATGRFAVYPSKGSKYYVLALDPAAGINIAPGESLARDSNVQLLSWAELTVELAAEPDAKQTVSIRTRIRGEDGYPEATLAQYWSDLNDTKPTNVFRFNHVPPIMETSISRDIPRLDGGSIGLNSASVSLLPGEERRIDLGKLSSKQREQVEELGGTFQQVRKPRREQNAVKAGAEDKTEGGKKK